MRRLASAVLIGCLLTACGANDPATDTETSSLTLPPTAATETAPTSSIPTGPVRNERSNIVKAFGETAGITDANGNDQATFTVDSIEVDPPCSGYAQPPENGHLLVISMRVTTAPTNSIEFFHIIADDWQVVGPDGITETNLSTASAYGCVAESERLTDSPMGPGQQFIGKLVLDSRNTTGAAIFSPPFVTGGGWEWVF